MSVDPIARFIALFDEVRRTPREILPEPTAFALGTVDPTGQPSVRIVLLKTVDERGFVFYTNFESRKGRELLASKKAALCFHWQHIETQVRIEGDAERVSDAEADAYFSSRPRGSQIGAWASQQSRAIAKEGDLEAAVADVGARYANVTVPRPPHWSGFLVRPRRMEFWKGMPSRLHVREVFTLAQGVWTEERLYP
jgi:pyridoxamine 5'-phosphate oxidase